jgi:Spy/CpxP family protein refolding chaperone
LALLVRRLCADDEEEEDDTDETTPAPTGSPVPSSATTPSTPSTPSIPPPAPPATPPPATMTKQPSALALAVAAAAFAPQTPTTPSLDSSPAPTNAVGAVTPSPVVHAPLPPRARAPSRDMTPAATNGNGSAPPSPSLNGAPVTNGSTAPPSPALISSSATSSTSPISLTSSSSHVLPSVSFDSVGSPTPLNGINGDTSSLVTIQFLIGAEAGKRMVVAPGGVVTPEVKHAPPPPVPVTPTLTAGGVDSRTAEQWARELREIKEERDQFRNEVKRLRKLHTESENEFTSQLQRLSKEREEVQLDRNRDVS